MQASNGFMALNIAVTIAKFAALAHNFLLLVNQLL
jgi:hypothetical protein